MSGALEEGPNVGDQLVRRRSRRRDVADLAEIVRRLEDLGLTANEARVLVAILQVGPAVVSDVARRANIHRTSVYPLLDSLRAAGLAAPFSDKSAQWTTIGLDKVLDRLFSACEERLRRLTEEKERLRDLLGGILDISDESLPAVQFVREPNQTNEAFVQMVRSASHEIVMFNRPPYGLAYYDPSEDVLEMLARNVTARVLYRRRDLDPLMAVETEAFIAAGLQARVVDELPTKLVVVDRVSVLMAMMDPDTDNEDGFPVSQHLEHAGAGAAWVAIFEQLWSTACPYEGT